MKRVELVSTVSNGWQFGWQFVLFIRRHPVGKHGTIAVDIKFALYCFFFRFQISPFPFSLSFFLLPILNPTIDSKITEYFHHLFCFRILLSDYISCWEHFFFSLHFFPRREPYLWKFNRCCRVRFFLSENANETSFFLSL